jgi:hypothetical protein
MFDKYVPPLKMVLVLASFATAGVGLWLFWVTTFVLPAHDPAQIPMWRTVAVCFLAYSALCGGYLGLGPRNPTLRWLVLAASVAALGVGIYGLVDMVVRASDGGDFEGYIVLMGLVLSGHGLAGILCVLLAGRVGARARG